MLLLYIIAAVYIGAVNLYAFLLVKAQKKRRQERGERVKTDDGKLLITALWGAAQAFMPRCF